MQVNIKKIKFWKQNSDPGDRTKLVELTGCSYHTIAKAFAGEAKQSLIIMIDNFYKEKAALIQSK
jgi:F0F1-type ATP synthase beta subunit